ncbi:MAG: hypothetical protein JXA98_06110 [Methanosarcinaceae archaeon]|nr:hypothetical protein [Methanosarcinaceae archaeon]
MIDEQEWYEEQSEIHDSEVVRSFTERTFELAIASRDEIIKNHLQECKRIIEIIDMYDSYQKENVWISPEIECLSSKLNEINETLCDSYFLLLSARYNTARMTLRKWIELVVISIYFDTTGKNESNRQKFLDVEDMNSPGFTDKLKKLEYTSCNDEIKSLYKKLSLYVHNEGRMFGQPLPFYYKKEFEDIYSIINEIQPLMEKMILKNCGIDIR